MKKLTWNPESDVYEAIMEAVLGKVKWIPADTYLIQLRLKDISSDDGSYLDITELLTISYEKGEDGSNYVSFEWEEDWWEGEDEVYIVGFAPVDSIDISESFPFEEEAE